MSARLTDETTTVPIADAQDVEIEPGMPWPSAYRGSRYSLVTSREHKQTVFQWKYNDLVAMVDPPTGLLERLSELGKSRGSGKGSVRVTAGGEVLTKIESSEYAYANQAPVDSGWIPVYLGTLDGEPDFDIQVNPEIEASNVTVWSGFPFNHGERWAVSYDNRLIWKWQDYRFYSAFEHPELIEAYQEFRTTAGRLYINEYGHVFVNVPQQQVPESKKSELAAIHSKWEQKTERQNDTAAQRLVTRRLKVTGGGNPEEGHLPLYIGHLSQFDDGLIPRPVVEDETYYVAAAHGEELSDY
ncbi:hypothetical protein KTS45_18625 [Halomicroarcula limicola]|uniref:Uncharacterized protein n=1 Tax=Haloarcula limicola TaxID=1429915 RepID=A0A8J7YFE6_9EURY|nr:hypothetical protein [Halomicroarcula limicola]MBV0926226.1 hypothetical protein [Halomicroarcula limicola]